MKQVKEKLKKHIAELGYRETSRQSGVPESSISLWLSGKRPMSPTRINKISKIFGYKVEVEEVYRIKKIK